MRPAYLLLRFWWRLRRPVRIEGAQVALWHGGQILVVRHSYIPGYGLPGGRFKRGEDPRQAARRELAEELGIAVAPEQLTACGAQTYAFEHGEVTGHIFEHRPAERAEPQIDQLEIVEARFVEVEEALAGTKSPHLRGYLEGVRRASSTEGAP